MTAEYVSETWLVKWRVVVVSVNPGKITSGGRSRLVRVPQAAMFPRVWNVGARSFVPVIVVPPAMIEKVA
jgi:hypothetical protein